MHADTLEALLPDDLEIYFMQFLYYTVIHLLHICCIPHLASCIIPTPTGSQNHTEREGNCLYQCAMSSAALQLVKQREGFK